MKVKMLACQTLWREAYLAASKAPHYIDIQLISPQTLTTSGLQQEIDRIDAAAEEYDAILLGCGLCGGALEGLSSRRHLVVLPRAHDCMTLLLGSRERYRRAFENFGGVIRFVSRGSGEAGRCPVLCAPHEGDKCCVVSPVPGLRHPCPQAKQEMAGDLALLERLVSGEWSDEDFLLLLPGRKIAATFTSRLASAE